MWAESLGINYAQGKSGVPQAVDGPYMEDVRHVLLLEICSARRGMSPFCTSATLFANSVSLPILGFLLARCWPGPERLRKGPGSRIRWSKGPDCTVAL